MAQLGDFFGSTSSTNQSAIALDAAAIALGVARTKIKYWLQGEEITDAAEIRVYNKIAYYAPRSSIQNPISSPETPQDAPDDWVQYTVNSVIKEQYTLSSGETVLTFNDIDCTNSVFFIDGPFVDSSRLNDSRFNVLDSTSIELTESYPQGTIITGYFNVSQNTTPNLTTVSESVVLTSGQVDVTFTNSIGTPTSFYLCGEFVDSARLCITTDYGIISPAAIRLTSSYPAGTILVGVFNDWGSQNPIDYNNELITAQGTGTTKRLEQWMAEGPVLTSPNGTKFVLKVANNGVISTTVL